MHFSGWYYSGGLHTAYLCGCSVMTQKQKLSFLSVHAQSDIAVHLCSVRWHWPVQRWTEMTVELYLIAHLGTWMDVETQIVVGEFGRLLLQLPGEGNLPAERTEQKKCFTDIWVMLWNRIVQFDITRFELKVMKLHGAPYKENWFNATNMKSRWLTTLKVLDWLVK